jgi:hypothetical protein
MAFGQFVNFTFLSTNALFDVEIAVLKFSKEIFRNCTNFALGLISIARPLYAESLINTSSFSARM